MKTLQAIQIITLSLSAISDSLDHLVCEKDINDSQIADDDMDFIKQCLSEAAIRLIDSFDLIEFVKEHEFKPNKLEIDPAYVIAQIRSESEKLVTLITELPKEIQ